MPRRESYQTDDEADDRRASASGGGGIPGWVWVGGGGAALTLLVVVGLGFAAFSRREAMARHEVDVARADMMRAEAHAMRAEKMAVADHGHGGMVPQGLKAVTLAKVATDFRTDRAAAEVRYVNQQVRVRVAVTVTGVRPNGEAWAGASADLGDGPPPGAEPNVVFRLAGDRVAAGTTVVIEGQCDGLLPDPRGGETLTFSDCRVVPQ